MIKYITAPGIQRFAVEDNFRDDTSNSASVKIGSISKSFEINFSPMVEWGIDKVELKMAFYSPDFFSPENISGATRNHAVRLGHLWSVLLPQGKGQRGDMLTNGRSVVCYSLGMRGLMAVVLQWYANGYWGVKAYPIGHSCKDLAVSQVIFQ